MRNVLLLKAGETLPAVRLAVGDYDAWFHEALVGAECRLHVRRPFLGEPLPRRWREWDAVWTTGSPASVTEGAPWMRRLSDGLLEAAAQGVPVLGVCFGHQLLAQALGGRVARSPRGREMGTVEVDLTPEGRADPLFDGLPERLEVHATHEDAVVEVPPGFRVLAGNAHTAVQAFAWGECVRGVQFHPEVSAHAMRAMIHARAEGLEAEARVRGERPGTRVPRLLAGVGPAPLGRRLLLNFLRHWT